jgi:bifunctional non-homologous end joining protein LigD
MILDGEAVVLDDQGRSDFGALQNALGGRGGKRNAGAAIFYAFDLLYYLTATTSRGWTRRNAELLLESMSSPRATVPVRLSEEIDADGELLMQRRLASTASKASSPSTATARIDPDEPATGSRSSASRARALSVVGYEPSTTMPGAIASLLLAARKGDSLVYVGSVGTGFKDSVARDLKQQLDQMPIATAAGFDQGQEAWSSPSRNWSPRSSFGLGRLTGS